MKPAVAAACVVLSLGWVGPARGQGADPKSPFLQSVGRLSAALESPTGDGGRELRAALDGMTGGLQQWDATLRAAEMQFASSLPGSPAVAAARMHIAMGAAYLDRGRVQDAVREFEAGSHLDPTRADVLTFEGVAYDQLLHDFDRAAASYRQAAALDPLNPTSPYLLARALARSGKREEALQAYQTVLRLWRRDVSEHAPIPIETPFVQLGLVQERPGVEPFFPPTQYVEGYQLLQRGAYSEAIEALNRATAMSADVVSGLPASGKTHYQRARQLQRENKTLEALAEYETALTMTPMIGVNRLLQAVGALQAAQQNFDAALQAYSTRVEIDLNDPNAHRTLGYLYARLERRDEAFAEFALTLIIAPNSPDVHVAMSQLALKEGDYTAAADAARRAIRLNPSNKQARYSLGTALMRLEKPDEAKPEFEAFERLQAEDTASAARQMTINGLRREAAAAMDTRDYTRAVAALRKALELAPDDGDVRDELADVEALQRGAGR